MSLYEELVKTAKESDNSIYNEVKVEILKLVDEIKSKTKEDANDGFFKSEIILSSDNPDYASIDYIYNDLDNLDGLSSLLSKLLGRGLVVSVTGNTFDKIKIEISWAGNLNKSIATDLMNEI